MQVNRYEACTLPTDRTEPGTLSMVLSQHEGGELEIHEKERVRTCR